MPDIVLQCPELDPALDYYTETLGFRLDMIFPADAPRTAELSGYDITMRLESEPQDRSINSGWHVGRAGMQYRDLVPGREGGAMIASHIRISNGGPVPDYVHYHHVLFQIIYVYKGWVRVVYEDQGPAFVMGEGDCVVQPPGIRHRVLECSDAFEVVEVGSPAEHETFVDHALELPNDAVNKERVFGGQRFTFHVAKNAEWMKWGTDGFEYRDTGIASATGDIGSVLVVRSCSGTRTNRIAQGDTEFMFVLAGTMSLHRGEGENVLSTGDAMTLPGGADYSLVDCSMDLELLFVSIRTGSDRSG
jgi:quercetin dioxygenase-like cupin family protein